MKTSRIHTITSIILLAVIFLSCSKEEEYTVDNQQVTGQLAYTRQSFIPLQFDSLTQMPVLASITLTGTGSLPYLGAITLVSTFKFDLVQGRGYDFVTTYTGADEADCFAATGSSQMQRDGSILVTESFSSGKGKFAKISGGGNTSVVLLPDGSAGSGTVDWRITY